MKKLAILILLLASPVYPQAGQVPGTGPSSGGSVAGCSTAGAILYMDASALLACGAPPAPTYDAANIRLQVGTGSTTQQGWYLGYGTISGSSMIWSTDVTPSGTNYVVRSISSGSTLFNGTAGASLAANGTAKATAFATAGQGIAITAGTATTDVQALSLTQTLNNAGVNFNAVTFDITETAVGGGTNLFRVRGGASGTTPLFEVASGVAAVNVRNSSLYIVDSGRQLRFGTGGAADTYLLRPSAAVAGTLQMGLDVNGAPVNQTFKAHDGITGTDVIGANLTLASGVGTGAAAGAQVNISRAVMRATGTTAQVTTPAFTTCESKTLSNTSATATAIVNITLPNNSSGAGRATISVQCNDGTNFDSDIVTSYDAYVNKAGVLTIGTAVTTGTAAANNSGSCTVAPTWVANGTTSIDLKVTPVITTISPTTTTVAVNFENFGGIQSGGGGAVTCK